MSYIEKMCCVNWRFRSFVQYIYRALDKLYFQKSTVLVHFLKKGVTRNFYEY